MFGLLLNLCQANLPEMLLVLLLQVQQQQQARRRQLLQG
jgi:hypothetical protein